MAGFTVDARPVYVTAAAAPGDDFRVTVGLLHVTDGAVDATGATVTATLGGTAMSVDQSTDGLFICTLTSTQTTALGAGTHQLLFKIAVSAIDTQTYVMGTVTLSSSSTTVSGSVGYQYGICQDVFVVVF